MKTHPSSLNEEEGLFVRENFLATIPYMKMLREYIAEAVAAKKAIGHFNISTVEVLWSIVDAAQSFAKASAGEAREAGEPVIIGVSEGERSFIGVRQVVALVKSIREEYGHPVFLNADHSYSFEAVKEVVDAGFDAVIFDGAEKSFEENVAITKRCVEYARSVNPQIVVEGELGYIGTSSKLLDEIPTDILSAAMTAPEQAAEYVEKTGVDLLAPSVGNLHGMLKHAANPALDISRIASIREAAGVPLVLHGGSGITDDDFRNAIRAGMAIVHINTEIRKAWRDAVKAALSGDENEVAPYKLLQGAKEAVRSVVEERVKLFTGFM